MKACALFLAFSLFGVDAFLSTPSKVGTDRLIATDSKVVLASKVDFTDGSKRRQCARCPEEEEEDSDIDRREALYAMMGSLVATMSLPAAASAIYGTDAKIELPNAAEYLERRQNGQCLVESLGNRECLVWLDPTNKLYQGADNSMLLERMEKAIQSFATIPALIEEKKWSQVSGVMLGPLGTLVDTMNKLTKQSENGDKAAKLAGVFKTHMYAIGSFAERKQGDEALAAHEQATLDLAAFVKSL